MRGDDIMDTSSKDIAVQKIIRLPKEEVSKVLIFIAGLEAGYNINDLSKSKDDDVQPCNLPKNYTA